MAIEFQPAATARRGSRGSEVYSVHPTKPGLLTVRAKSEKKITLDEERKPNAAIFGCIGHFSSTFIKAIQVGFPKNALGEKGANLFTRVNKKNCIGEATRIDPTVPISKTKKATEEFSVAVHYDKLLVADGPLFSPEVKLETDEETGHLTFRQESGTIEGGRNSDTDLLYAVIYDTMTESCLLRHLRTRGESGTTIVELPKVFKQDNLAVYVFATTAKKNMASKSVCLKFPAIENV